MLKKLTDTFVSSVKLPPQGKQAEYCDAFARGLRLRVSYRGTRTWVAACRVLTGGAWKQCRVTLGHYPAMPLTIAREKAAEAQAMAAAGKDPTRTHIEARRALEAASRDTFGAVCDRFLQDCKTKLRAKTYREYDRILNSALFTDWTDRPISEITRRDVLDVLRPLGQRIRANRTLAVARVVLNWAASQAIIEHPPTQHIDPPAKETRRDRALSDDEIKTIWPAFDSFFKVLLLTGQRRGEVAAMRWAELDLDGGVWTLPKERTKNGRPHVVPLAPAVVKLLAAMPRHEHGAYVFSTTDGRVPISGFTKIKKAVDNAMKAAGHEIAPWTIHDLRRSAATGMGSLGVAPHVIELVLNHVSGSRAGVAGIYQRAEMLPERRRALDTWAAHVERLTGQAGMLRAVA